MVLLSIADSIEMSDANHINVLFSLAVNLMLARWFIINLQVNLTTIEWLMGDHLLI